MGKFLPALLLAVAAGAQTPPVANKEGVIRGVVRDAVTGTPVAGAEFRDVWSMTPRATTDAQGRYSLRGLAPGQQRVTVYVPDEAGTLPVYAPATRFVALASGQELSSVDFSLVRLPEVSGRVLDPNKEPVPGVWVFLVAREYAHGALRYVYSIGTRTNDQGDYVMRAIHPGRSYLVMATRHKSKLDAISDSPRNPKLRKPALLPTYYPGTPAVEGAQPISLRAGERREGIDITLLRAPAYCVEGVLKGTNGPGALAFTLEQQQPTIGTSGSSYFYFSFPRGVTGSNGDIRICELPPGEYQLTVSSRSVSGERPAFYGSTPIAIVDADIKNVSVVARPQVPVSGEVAWAGDPPDPPFSNTMGIRLVPLTRGMWGEDMTGAKSPIPGTFSFSGVPVGDYEPRVADLPPDAYIKDITYAGRSITHERLRVGSAIGNATLRIVLALDGGTLAAKVVDKDGNPIPDAPVVMMPAAAPTDVALADSLVSGWTDQNDSWTSARLAPGKYHVLALTSAPDKSPECIGKLLLARNHAKEVELAPKASVQVTLSPRALD